MKNIFIILLTISFFSCEKKIEKILPEGNFNDIIIDAFITSKYKNQEIILSIPNKSQNDTLIPISGAFIFLRANSLIYYFTESDSLPGHYFSDLPFAGVIETSYYLEVQYNSKIYSANTYMLPVTFFNPLVYTYNQTSGLYSVDWVAEPYSADEEAMYEVFINQPDYNDSTNVRAFYYTFNTVDVSQAFAANPKNVVFYPGSTIIENKYSLTPDYAKYLRALASETMWQGGLFSESPSNLPTNIKGGALGYFSVCAVASISISVD
jgi:hypothetical protein